MRVFFYLVVLIFTWGISVYHASAFVPPPPTFSHPKSESRWLSRQEMGLNHLILFGSPYERGLFAGQHTANLLLMQEEELIGDLNRFFSFPPLRRVLEVLAFRWFMGIDRYFEDWMLSEMHGVSKSAPEQFNNLGDTYNRQIYYHALHEVGQMMVDQKGEAMGCTVVAVPKEGSWIIGRNFDFEAGRVFDSEKIVKWVFPDQGNAFVSVIWAGMVGAVTGINEKGVYISLNAAGSEEKGRLGLPSTLSLLKALQFADSSEQAVESLKKDTLFITDVFAVADARSPIFYRVEKSPTHTEVISSKEKTVIANHLIAERWKDDGINRFRRDDLTSGARELRAKKILQGSTASEILSVLRDKGDSLHLGHRSAIDGLIAAHATIYDAPAERLYVSEGPGVSGAFQGFDLKKSFANKFPVKTESLSRDSQVSEKLFLQIAHAGAILPKALKAIRNGKCEDARLLIDEAAREVHENYLLQIARGDYEACVGNYDAALSFWRKAKALSPPYQKERAYLEEKLK